MTAETFAVGDSVIFREEKRGDTAISPTVEQFGIGPFNVVKVEKVPDRCGYCERPVEHRDPRYETCRPMRESVGHSQWVKIMTPDGTLISQPSSKWSGAWFRKTS